MEKQGKFGADWVEGFTKQAMATGVGPEEVKQLLKTAMTLEQMKNKDFFAGFNKAAEAAGIDKAAGLWGRLGKMLGPKAGHLFGSRLGTAGLTAGAMGAGYGLNNLWNRHVNRDDMDRRYMDMMDMANKGLISYEDAIGHGRNQSIQQARRNLRTMGAKDGQDPYSQWYNFG